MLRALLPIFLLLAQSAAIAHELGHLLRTGTDGSGLVALVDQGSNPGLADEASLPGGTPVPASCDACASYAQIASAIGCAFCLVLPAALAVAADALAPPAVLPADPPAPRGRGPPTVRAV